MEYERGFIPAQCPNPRRCPTQPSPMVPLTRVGRFPPPRGVSTGDTSVPNGPRIKGAHAQGYEIIDGSVSGRCGMSAFRGDANLLQQPGMSPFDPKLSTGGHYQLKKSYYGGIND
jgi:hypothetical protein